MKATPQKPGPNGSRVVKRRSIPRLGDGLCDILNGVSHSLATDKESVTTTTTIRTRNRNSSTSTASESPPDTNVTTPVSCVGSSNISQSHRVKEQLEASGFDRNSHNISTPNLQHCGLSSSTSTSSSIPTQQFLPHVASSNKRHGDRLSSISPVTPPSTHPAHMTPAHLLSARILEEYRLRSDSALSKIIEWFLNGTLSLSETKELAKKYQYCGFLDALEALHPTMTPNAFHGSVIQSREFIAPVAASRPAEYSTLYTSDNLHSGAYLDAVAAIRQHFRWKIMKHVDIDKLVDPSNVSKLHLFVDISNIFIGFCDAIKVSRRIPQSHRIPAPVFSFKTFAVLMERGRAVQKRILAGSTPGYSADNLRKYWPRYFSEAEELCYEMNIFCRVQTRKPNQSKRRGRKSPKTTSHEVHDLSTGESTGDDGSAMAYEVRTGEQGVDENLHLNMMNSMWDHISCPGTMVLATGDAASAEFSNGFLHYATRALEKGWKLELVTWKHSISSAWTNEEFSEKYSNQFRIIYLDDFLEELQMKAGDFST
ncbi:hypothetical protein F4805DRAFT_460595 [Annulohypoxylon moriforme]|nr:hypothetical protein F4805DRAFT_460595 [Annulohypoxylon moriforme]